MIHHITTYDTKFPYQFLEFFSAGSQQINAGLQLSLFLKCLLPLFGQSATLQQQDIGLLEFLSQ